MDAKAELVRGWLIKASHDLAAARKLGEDLRDVAVYHCQQAAEKALKAFLAYHDARSENTHDVGLLVERAMEFDRVFESCLDSAERLTPYATAYRYPGIGDQPEMEEYIEALADAETILQQVLALLPQSFHPPASPQPTL